MPGSVARGRSAERRPPNRANGNNPPPHPPQIAERAVPPVLLTAGVGLLVGDVTAALAILRPDYTSGPKIGDSLAQLFQLARCLDEGIVIRRADVLEQMAAADLLL